MSQVLVSPLLCEWRAALSAERTSEGGRPPQPRPGPALSPPELLPPSALLPPEPECGSGLSLPRECACSRSRRKAVTTCRLPVLSPPPTCNRRVKGTSTWEGRSVLAGGGGCYSCANATSSREFGPRSPQGFEVTMEYCLRSACVWCERAARLAFCVSVQFPRYTGWTDCGLIVRACLRGFGLLDHTGTVFWGVSAGPLAHMPVLCRCHALGVPVGWHRSLLPAGAVLSQVAWLFAVFCGNAPCASR